MNKRNKASRPGGGQGQGGPASRTQRQRSIAADGIYNNSLFMHAATSHVGNIVQVQTASGVIYEGVFRTFSSQFQVVLEMAHRIEHGGPEGTESNKIIVDTVVDRLIFKPCDIVSIAAKDVDLDYATRDTFKTDTAISSARCNGNGRPEERELEPWDESGGGGLNGDGLGEFSLELDANANGWDVNDMFHKNETIYGVQSTFDQSLTGYTVQITKKDSDDFKHQESEAERIANEIENNPVYKDRIDLENGDEEDAFAAVVRPAGNAAGSPQPGGTGGAAGGSAQNSMNDKSAVMPSNTKYIVPAKRKGHAGKLTARSTPPPLTNNGGGPLPQQQQPPQQQSQPQQQQQQSLPPQQPQQQQPLSPQAPPHKNNSYQTMSMPPHQQQQQQVPPSNQQHGGQYGAMHSNQYGGGHGQHQQQPHQQQQQQQHSQSSVVNSNTNMNKMNGDGGREMSNSSGGSSSSMNVNSNTKPLPQRTVRQYPSSAPNYAEPPPSLGPQQGGGGQMQSMGKPPMHVTHPHHATHMPPPPVVANDQPQQMQPQQQVVMTTHHVGMPPPHINQAGGPPQQQQQMQQPPPPQPQRQVVVRRDMDDLRKFGQDFKLAPPQQQQQPPMQHQQPPPQQHGVQQHQQQQEQPPLESSPPISQKHSEPPPHQQQNQSSQTGMVHQQQQQQPPQQHMVQSQQTPQSQPPPQQQQNQQPSSTSPPQQQVASMNTSTSSNTSPAAVVSSAVAATSTVDNSAPAAEVPAKAPPKKTFTLNPAAKPFTPRSPSTPNPSRHTSSSPHTPQTPGPVLVQQQQQQQPQQQQPAGPGAYPGQQHVPQPQPILMSYVLQPPQTAFQTTQQHPHAGQQPRIRKAMSVVPPSQMAASQMAAAATGQPLLTPGPIPMFPPFPPTIHHQHFQAAPSFQPAYRIYETPQPTQIQYLAAATPPSTTPSPGQPHQQYHPGPQPSPAAAGPPTYAPAHQQQPPHYQMMCVAPQMVPAAAYQNMTQAAPLQNHHQQNLHVMHVQQHPAQ